MAIDPKSVLDVIQENHGENVWSNNLQTAILGLLSTILVGSFGWLVAFLRKVGKMEVRLDMQAKLIEDNKEEIAENKRIFDIALAESKASRQKINDSIDSLHTEHAKTRETLAAQPTKQDFRDMETRISRLIYRKPPDDFFDSEKRG